VKFKLLPFLIILLIVLSFWGKLFFPEPKLLYTPDYGRSDIWNQNYPFKDFLARSLKRGELPFWSQGIGAGFPMFAEMQVGALYIFNLVFYYLFPTWIAWNLNIVLAFMLAFLGAYLFFRHLKISEISSLISAFSFSFGGHYLGQIVHKDFLQSASLMPWLFLASSIFWNKPSFKSALLVGLILSQQFFAGGVQWMFISILGTLLFLVLQFREKTMDDLVKKLVFYGVVLLFGLLLAAPQFLTSLEYKNISVRRNSLTPQQIFQFPYRFNDLLTFVLPGHYGNPSDASYPNPFTSESGIFWENVVYIGILPLIFLLVSVLKKKRHTWSKAMMFLGVFSLLLALGDRSPLSFLFSLPLFNQFRVPARYLILTTFAIATLAAEGIDSVLNYIEKKKKFKRLKLGVGISLLFIAMLDIFKFGYFYHPLVTVKEALEYPETAKRIVDKERIFTSPEHGRVWNEAFFERGWRDTASFLYFKNGLDADLNLLFDKHNVQSYSGLPTIREALFNRSLPVMLNAAAVKHIITPVAIDGAESLRLDFEVESPQKDLAKYYVYENIYTLSRFRLVSNYAVTEGFQDLLKIINQKDFSFDDWVILEKDLGEEFSQLSRRDIEVIQNRDQQIELITDTDVRSVLVIADSFYPSWKAEINDAEVEIIPANINQRALVVPAGRNKIKLYYYPRLFYMGLGLSAASLLIFAAVYILSTKLKSRK
jgi:hypothetical protein